MWFQFPEGSSGCSVEQQSFSSEFTGKDGREWFRAPDHFAPQILGMALDYAALPPGEKPEGCEVDDLTPQFGVVGAQIGEQATVIASLRSDLGLANESIQKLSVQQRQAESEVGIIRIRNAELEKENENLKARIADFESPAETADALVSVKTKK